MLTKFTRDSAYSETKDSKAPNREKTDSPLQKVISSVRALLSSLSDRLISTTISAETDLSAQSSQFEHFSTLLLLHFFQNI